MNDQQSNITMPEDWAEWFEKCAVDLCGEKARHALSAFASLRYRAALERETEIWNMADKKPVEATDFLNASELEHCWRDLEAIYWYQEKEKEKESSADGRMVCKTYKKFYQENAARIEAGKGAEEARNFLEGSVSDYLIKTRCRTLITHSLQRIRGYPSSGGSSEEFDAVQLPSDSADGDPTSAPPTLEDIDESARFLIELFSNEEKLVLLECLSGNALNSDWLKSALGKGKSAIYAMRPRLESKLRNGMNSRGMEREDSQSALIAMRKILEAWKNSPESPYANRLGK